jgi:hypothetical protein
MAETPTDVLVAGYQEIGEATKDLCTSTISR